MRKLHNINHYLFVLFDILSTFYFTNSLLYQVSHVHLPSFRIIIPMRLSPNQIERTMTFLATLTVVPLVLKGRPFFPFYVLVHKSVNLKYITVGRLDDDMIVPPSDGAMFILID